MKKIKELIHLSSEKLVRALFIIGISTSFYLYTKSLEQNTKLREEAKKERLEWEELDKRKTLEYNETIRKIQEEANRKYETYLEKELIKLETTNNLINKTIYKNNKIIKKLKR